MQYTCTTYDTDFQTLPYILVANPHIKRVYESYKSCFYQLRRFPLITTTEQERAYTAYLERMIAAQTEEIPSLARGIRDCHDTKPELYKQLDIDAWMAKVIRTRISRRVIAEHHICLHHPRPNYIGGIRTNFDLHEFCKAMVARTRSMCEQTYGQCPPFEITGHTQATLACLPAHVEYMLFEVLKNSARAVVEHFREKLERSSSKLSYTALQSLRMPPIQLLISEGTRDVTIRVSDRGGGVHPSKMESIWKFGYSTVGNDGVGRKKNSDEDSGRLCRFFFCFYRCDLLLCCVSAHTHL
jgi:[3-methyl-2-oxobutanoate dehydrogenase (acetyl-transferring)] kinase